MRFMKNNLNELQSDLRNLLSFEMFKGQELSNPNLFRREQWRRYPVVTEFMTYPRKSASLVYLHVSP